MAKNKVSLVDTIVPSGFGDPLRKGELFPGGQWEPGKTFSFNSFSGADIRAMIAMPAADGEEPIHRELGNIQTLSYSLYREKFPVRAVGFVGEKGRTRGTRTIAGSLVFTVFDRHVLWDVMRQQPGDKAQNAVTPKGFAELAHTMADQLPPFDIVLHFANEYGFAAELVLFGIEINQEGQTMSIQDLITENVMQYTARHIAVMRPGGFKSMRAQPSNSEKTFESIMRKEHSDSMRKLIATTHNPYR